MTLLFSLGVGVARPASAAAPATAGVRWRPAGEFVLEGKGWADTAGPYDRLPESAQAKVNAGAWKQSKDSAGMAVRFVTDAAEVSVRWSVTSASLDMPHMPATGCSGLDLYARTADEGWRFVGNCRPGKQDGNVARVTFPDGAKPGRECLLYLPLYNGTKSLEVGVSDSSRLEKPPERPEARRKPLVVYGTSITQGGCASRPGLAWPSIAQADPQERTEVRMSSDIATFLPAESVRRLPKSSEYLPSAAPSQAGGGEFATDPRDPSGMKTQQEQFEVVVTLNNPDGRYAPGQQAHVRFKLDKRPLIWQWGRRFWQLIQTNSTGNNA